MRIPRIFVELSLKETHLLILPAGPSRHLRQVLRLRAGEPLSLFNGDGRDYEASLLGMSKAGAMVQVGTGGDLEPIPTLAVHLGIGVSKGERMDFALQKAVELGVTRITPLFTHRSLVRLDGTRLEKRQQHWRGVVIAACEQSGRRRLAQLATAATLEHWLTQSHPCPLLLHHRSRTPLPGLPAPDGALTLLVGPEGGLAERERALALEAGFTGVRLGPRVLRTETAAMAALAAAQTLWGDFVK